MAKVADVVRRAKKDRAFHAGLIVNPKRALADAGLEVEDPVEATHLELLVKASQENLSAAGRGIGIDVGRFPAADWGIGGSCCNSKLLKPGADVMRSIRSR